MLLRCGCCCCCCICRSQKPNCNLPSAFAGSLPPEWHQRAGPALRILNCLMVTNLRFQAELITEGCIFADPSDPTTARRTTPLPANRPAIESTYTWKTRTPQRAQSKMHFPPASHSSRYAVFRTVGAEATGASGAGRWSERQQRAAESRKR